MNKTRPKTEAVRLEGNMRIGCFAGVWEISVGGGQMPHWSSTGDSLEEAISNLVFKTTRDAIEDEAREWNDLLT